MNKKLLWVTCFVVGFGIGWFTEPLQAAERGTVNNGTSYHLVRSGQFIDCLALHVPGSSTARQCVSLPACEAQRDRQRVADAENKTSGSTRYVCRAEQWTNVSYGPNQTTPLCSPPSPPSTVSLACPSGYSGTWRQTSTTTVGPPPSCTQTVVLNPSSAPTSGECIPVPVIEPPTGCVGKVCSFTWDYPSTPLAEGFRLHYSRNRTSWPESRQLPGGTLRRGELTLPDSGVWYVTVSAYGGGNQSGLSNIEQVTVP